MWLNKFLNSSYDSIVEGMAWYKSAPILADVKAYIDYVERRTELEKQRDAIQKQIDQAYSQFMAYNKKYKDNFKRVRSAKIDF
jgi:malate synthase